jgi:hypothetical protein
MVGLIFIGLLVVVVLLYLSTIARSRAAMDRLHQPPDDLRRADDNQQPPQDGSAGLV